MSVSKVTSLNVGVSSTRFTDLDETPQNISTDECNLYGWNIINPNTSSVYVKFYNLEASNVTVGTSVPIKTILIPSEGIMGVTVDDLPEFHADTALSVAATTGSSDGDTTAPTLDLIGDFSYG